MNCSLARCILSILGFGIFQIASAQVDISAIQAIRDQRDQTIWKPERLAQDYETAFIELWDGLRASDNSYEPLRSFEFESLESPRLNPFKTLPEGVLKAGKKEGRGDIWKRSQFLSWMTGLESAGYRMEQTEWHHSKFEAPENEAARSEFSFAIHAKGPEPTAQRYIVRGVLEVLWQDQAESNGTFNPKHIGIKTLDLLTRETEVPFEENLWLESDEKSTPYSIVLVEDLNGDGLSDIAFPKRNALYLNQGNFQFRETLLTQFPIKEQVTAAAFIDLNLDGRLEYVVAIYGAPYLFAYTINTDTAEFDGKPFGIWKSDTPLEIQLIAAGDLTGDGLPELYLGPSTPAYEGGKMPTPYFDANDGKPAYLLQNTGGLRYADIAAKTDLSKKLGRRAYVASMLDLNDDQRMDLVVTSDFSGIDFYENTGGTLADRTDSWVDNRSLFGMSQAFADFNRDGEMDIMAVGMSSTTARRLEQMGLGRNEFPQHQEMRMNIAYGNRLYYGQADKGFAQSDASADVARSGWSWGCSSFDFNNDSYPDIFIANGYLSKSTARDYCTHFWTHDIYLEKSATLSQMNAFFDKLGPKALVGGNQMGWNPFEKDHLYLNLDGNGFVNVSYLFGVSNGGDGRAVVGEDFDLDGRVDLLLVEQDSLAVKEMVYFYRNGMETGRSWVGFDLKAKPGKAILGTKVRVKAPHYATERVYTVGEAFSAQMPSRIHFGLGEIQSLESIEVLWPDGELDHYPDPKLNQYHKLSQ